MNTKIEAFLEWLYLNEYELQNLPRQTPEKKLFWLYWLQWHLDYYLTGSHFALGFRPGKAAVDLLIVGPDTVNGILEVTFFPFRRTDILYRELTELPDDAAKNDFEEHIIPDIELKADPIDRSLSETINFREIIFKTQTIYTKSDNSLLALKFFERNRTSQEDSEYPVFVKLLKSGLWGELKLEVLYEFDHFFSRYKRDLE